jgi:hypothetical protein
MRGLIAGIVAIAVAYGMWTGIKPVYLQTTKALQEAATSWQTPN